MAVSANFAATVKFIWVIHQLGLFDVLNFKHPLAKEYKSVLTPSNEQFWRPFLEKAVEYLAGLEASGSSSSWWFKENCCCRLYDYDCKCRWIISGLRFNRSYHEISDYVLDRLSHPDYIWLTSNATKSRGRWNNNPTASQFQAAYKWLLINHMPAR